MNKLSLNPSALENNAAHAEALLVLMANKNRLLTLCRLCQGEMSVTAIATEIGLSQSALSQHLAKMRAGGLVTTRRDGQTIYYSLTCVKAKKLIETLSGLYSVDGAA